jgi:tetratricopeptide (TPR) repeat protein
MIAPASFSLEIPRPVSSSVMPKLLACLILLVISLPLFAQDVAVEEKLSNELPGVESCIPKAVSDLRAPSVFPFHNGLITAVTAATRLAQTQTLQGLNHLHGGWEFEASRHFAIAMKEDPRCLMAHWGMLLCILSPNPETDDCRFAVTERMLQLVNDGEGTELERGYAYGIVKYIEEGPKGAASAFRKVANKYPGELQAEIFAALFGRTGYDDNGEATPNQERAEKRLGKLIEADPNSAIPVHAMLLIRAEAPDLRPTLALARKLCQIVPDYAPYFHTLGHYEWRCGEHSKAASAFGRAATLYSIWMKENEVSPADCDGWVRAECYRSVALASKGEFDLALRSAEKLANTTVDSQRPAAPGTRQLLWEGKTLPARVLLRRGLKGDSAKALASLPSPEEMKPFLGKSLSYWWIDGLRIALEAQRLLDAGIPGKASEVINAMSYHGEAMSKKQVVSSAIGERSEWNRAFRSLEVLAAELRGRLALAGPPSGHGSAFNWFRAATDRQVPSTMLAAPPILTPMAIRLGDYFLTQNEPAKAVEAYLESLAAFPNDVEALRRLEKSYTQTKQADKAAEVAAKIAELAPN